MSSLPRSHVPLLGDVCPIGLATRGNTSLDPDDVLEAVDRGVNYLNWCGHPDGMQEAIRNLGSRRSDVRIAVQFKSSDADTADRELEQTLKTLNTDYLDVATYYYVEHIDEWKEIAAGSGAASVLEAAREAGVVRCIGLTSHQRPLAAKIAQSGRIDLLMIRYNAAHRGAEQDVFPVTTALRMPVVAFTCLRWGALLKPTPEDPPGFVPPTAADCYRFCVSHPAVAVSLMAPNGRAELDENLMSFERALDLSRQALDEIRRHGDRVRKHAGRFP